MSLEKITEQQMNEKGVCAAPDILNGTPAENKAIFDRMVRMVVAPAYNACVDAVEQINAQQKQWGEAEAGRVNAEVQRDAAETDRAEEEKSRQTAEAERARAEEDRTRLEDHRVLDEGNRIEAEKARAEAERARESAELARNNAENIRLQYDGDRERNERDRIIDEAARAEAEKARAEAEQARVEAEQARVEAEQARLEAEQDRVDTDNGIVAQATAQAQAAASSAKAAADSAEEAKTAADSAAVDNTLTQSGKAADAAEVGNQLRALSEEKVGDLSALKTTDKSSLVAAINEVLASIGSSGGEDAGIPVEAVTLDQDTIEVNTGSTVQLVATVLPEDATDQTLEWYSSNEEIATVDQNGLITGVAEGSCTIMAAAASGVYAECAVTVAVEAPASEWTIEWDYTMGMPEDNGFTVSKMDNATVSLTDDGLLVTAGENYSKAYSATLPAWSGGKIIVECEYITKKTWYEGNPYGTRIIAGYNSAGAVVYTHGALVGLSTGYSASMIKNATYENDDFVSGTDIQCIRIEYDANTGLTIYFNGTKLIESTTLSAASEISFAHVGQGSTLFKAFRVKMDYSEVAA